MQKFWNCNKSSKGGEFNNNILNLLVLVSSHKIADLGAHNGCELDEAEQKGSHWLIEFFRAAQRIFHHVNTISDVGQALPMEDHHTEKLAKVYSSIIFVGKIKCLVHQKGNDEGELHDSHEQSSVKDVHLIV